MKANYLLTLLFVIAINYCSGQQLAHPVALSSNSNTMVSQSPDSRAWTDPALNHNKLVQQNGTHIIIGNFRVIGTPFLLGQHHRADMFATEAKAHNIIISYNTYNQEIEFQSTSNPNEPLVKEPGTVDSFVIQKNAEHGVTENMKFIYGPVIGSKEKYYFQEICKGTRFTIYKRYKSELSYSTSNLAQTDLRQFDLQIEYYYADNQGKGLKKIKANAASVIKEFKETRDLSSQISVDEFTINPEGSFCKTISLLNESQKGF